MTPEEIRSGFDETAAFAVGDLWVSVALASTLIDAGAIKRSALLRTIEAYIDLLRAHGQPAVAQPLEKMFSILETPEGQLPDVDVVELAAAYSPRRRRAGDDGSDEPSGSSE